MKYKMIFLENMRYSCVCVSVCIHIIAFPYKTCLICKFKAIYTYVHCIHIYNACMYGCDTLCFPVYFSSFFKHNRNNCESCGTVIHTYTCIWYVSLMSFIYSIYYIYYILAYNKPLKWFVFIS